MIMALLLLDSSWRCTNFVNFSVVCSVGSRKECTSKICVWEVGADFDANWSLLEV